MLGANARRYGSHALPFVGRFPEQRSQFLREQMAVDRFLRGLDDLNPALIAIDKHNDLTIGNALNLDGIETGELEKRTEITTHVAIDDRAREGGDRHGDGLAGSWILGDAPDGTGSDDYFILRAVPSRVSRYGVPKQPEVKASPTDKCAFHLLINGPGLDCAI